MWWLVFDDDDDDDDDDADLTAVKRTKGFIRYHDTSRHKLKHTV